MDTPEIKIKVTEHRAEVEVIKCPKCRRRNTGKFPAGITNTVHQYGEKVKAVSVYVIHVNIIYNNVHFLRNWIE